jgi:hypothetical protein
LRRAEAADLLAGMGETSRGGSGAPSPRGRSHGLERLLEHRQDGQVPMRLPPCDTASRPDKTAAGSRPRARRTRLSACAGSWAYHET